MEISAVKLRNSYKIYFIDTNNIYVNQNAICVVETEHGIDVGRVVKIPKYQNNPDLEPKGKLLRLITKEDEANLPELIAIEEKAYKLCKEKAKAKDLKMKLISIKCLFDKTKIIFYFVAENRIDFRELVRELAAVFRTRIEMRQIGVRDEARLVGGFGLCGRKHCCVHQREEFDPVSIKMAKEQNLNLNSLKISGMCGRLLCCLGYEYDTYKTMNKNLPKIGTEIKAGDDAYTVISCDTLDESIRMRNCDRVIKIHREDMEFNNNHYTINKERIKELIQCDEHPEEEEEDDDDLL
ncbi:MAG: regulatory iron-sulfur-containing complex subunit RicT [Bacteroidales bacterium]|jgi:cell fate regulator YaaT (PSP1 superfamily)|nr:regulatory iron-sulfur-containing complex subunit RicT [Bacteroidales bacterium]